MGAPAPREDRRRAAPRAAPRRSGWLALGAVVAAALAPWRQRAFAQPRARPAPGEAPAGSRAARLIVPAALLAAPLPGHASAGVTKAWGKDPTGNDDDLHTGGVEWEDVKVGTGASPKVGDLVAIQFKCTAVVRERDITIDDTKGKSRDYRYGVGQMLPGMDEGMWGMKTGGVRKMRIPGNLAFGSKSIPAAPGRPSVPSYTPVEVEVQLDFIPGSDDVYDYGLGDEENLNKL